MQVHHALATAGKVALGCLVMLAFAALAIVGANVGLSLSAGSLRPATPSTFLASPTATPAEVLAARFPSYFSPSAAPATPAEVLAARFPAEEAQQPAFSTARVVPTEHGETFDLTALSGMATAEPAWPAADGIAPAEAATTEPPQARRPSARSPNVVNDGMIASIRQRLKLTVEQDKLWPPVEAALRKIVYTRAAMNPQRGSSAGPTAYIDPSSPEVQELKSAALPLLMRLNDQQKREVKELAFVMGLEAVASQF